MKQVLEMCFVFGIIIAACTLVFFAGRSTMYFQMHAEQFEHADHTARLICGQLEQDVAEHTIGCVIDGELVYDDHEWNWEK